MKSIIVLLQVVLHLSSIQLPIVSSFTIHPNNAVIVSSTCSHTSTSTSSSYFQATPTDDDNDEDTIQNKKNEQKVENVWRHVKKPLLRIGGKGITSTHGNSLIELLNDHTVVKVKINTTKLGTLVEVADLLVRAAEIQGGGDGIEVIQVREIENTVLLGKKGATALIMDGTFPPPVVVWQKNFVKDKVEE
mmetsp:Transcript_23915/g.28218  ORF Transcript_23915/g.28218 Transcript_23915/m.28218 type:complete len:190 (-) Transcript_23915:96-665(-)|eukprot:CAMPEP_0198253456 /NCGR_PEP_ID=MMETSP1447-20131203/3871_1 /TAXON_ID=420782 /ORGANISM="Chaetoceros dichaeta, Strain CCMP1751" /LENGTH=189 /DNA_ID=CAMNT_0043939125 /DNA_START=83 /DNA_END=652 /DNA_ORIENTATION=-